MLGGEIGKRGQETLGEVLTVSLDRRQTVLGRQESRRVKESLWLASWDDPARRFIAAEQLENLVTKNIETLRKLYDEDRETFSYRVYIDSYPLLNLLTRSPLPMHVLSMGVQQEAAYRGKEVKVDGRVDLKYVGHAIVGLAEYCSVKGNGCGDFASMACNSLKYLMRYQTKSGALRCRHVSLRDVESGTDGRSIAETTESFLWAVGAMCKLSGNHLQDLVGRALKAGKWLIENKQFLSPQEVGRSIYGLSHVRDAEPKKEFSLWIKCLAEDLIHRLGTSRSFGVFPNDIDSIGGLSAAYLGTGCRAFMSVAGRLVRCQLANQGAQGQWRWLFNRKGNYRRFWDLTYSVHQLGMAPWALALYIATADIPRHDVDLKVANGIRWILDKRPFFERFIVRSFSGLTGRPIELEQRAYEPGLNLLGLLSHRLTDL